LSREIIVGVAVDTPLRRTFDYRCPTGPVAPGSRLWVPFGRRRVVGVVTENRDHTDVPAGKLRSIASLIDEDAPAFEPILFKLLLWAADYYRHPVGEVLAAALPPQIRDGTPLREEEIVWRTTPIGREQGPKELTARATKLRGALEFLLTVEAAPASAVAATTGASATVLRKLAERGWVESFRRIAEATAAEPAGAGAGPELNEAQGAAVERIVRTLGTFAPHLLYGVTGSGKTEVYLNAIASVIERGEQALVLVPEIALTPQLIARFRTRFARPLAVLHSALGDSERLAAWRSARDGTARIVIGTRSAVFSPLARPGLIVVDEEHDPSFKQQDGFRYSGRDLAIARAQRLNIPVVLGSATPSLESLARVQRQPELLSRLPQRAANAQPPRLSLIDMRKHGETQGIATPAVLAIRKHLDAGNQAMLFLNRRGYAPVLFCPACGWSAHCKRCDAHLTVHGRSRSLICHHCGSQSIVSEVCPSCGAPPKPVGQGTERIEEVVRQLYPDAPLARIDRDSMRRKGELEETLARVDRKEVRILVGTQMLTKGHDFPNVTLVVVLNADQGLFSTDFRASERLAQTIIQVAGRAGRAERPGEVLIQTEYPDHPLLTLLLNGGYEAFAAGALEERERTGWPPFSRIALVRAEAATAAAPMKFLQAAMARAREQSPRGVRLLGPAPAPMERRAGRYRAQLLLHSATHGPLQKFMAGWIPALEALPEGKRVRWSIDVDAIELF
jgi:primosomal protein N' (replication factor Y) (superfamily II helicase)